ncbi:MAG: flagellar basal-body MS-ring/collar protein FliF [Peptostreptococcaceae bacterium]
MQQNFIQNLKTFFNDKKEAFKKLEKSKKYAIVIGVLTIVLATGFSVSYSMKNKYSVLFSGLETYDASNISKELENRKVDTKIKGDTIYVPTKEVDKLRLELSSTISNGSKGFELLDEGSSFSMTDEEFSIKKQRMIQGELEKTIKTFPQVEDARVHITQGEQSVFSKDNKEGKAGVYVVLKSGQELDGTQIKSIMSLVSASCTNIPKQNIEVIDQGMNLLSEGIYDENGNLISKGVGLTASRTAEKELNDELQKSVVSMLEPIFGKDKVKATVNARLNFDTVEKTEIKIDPDKVAISETRSENSSSDKTQTGSPVDNNMSNTGQGGNENSNSKEEHVEYEVGKTETKTITTSGEVKRITASVAVDGLVDPVTIAKVEDMVAGAIGMDTKRGDQISVVAMEFSTTDKDALTNAQIQQQKNEIIRNVAFMVGAAVLLILIVLGVIYIKNKKENKEGQYLDTFDSENVLDLLDEKEELTLEEEVKVFASKNPDEVTELLKTWLNE